MRNEKSVKIIGRWLYLDFCDDLKKYVKGFKGFTLTKGNITIDLWADEFWELLTEFYEKKKKEKS